ncbi:T-complex protein 1 subunit alpha, partial [Wuchereria bancrofti]
DAVVTNDGATILKQIEVEHPAAKVLVELAQLQDEEVGDGTTSVVIVAAELLKSADELVKQQVHPTTVINGYRLACKESVRYMQDAVVTNDGATILKQIEVEHPAAKVLVELAQLQDEEVFDCTLFLLCKLFAGYPDL